VLCTVIYDAYTVAEQIEVHEALRTLLSPGQPDWSPQGVYAYWDRASHEILYLGLAKDLSVRFAQHNSLVSHSGGNKSKEIADYFSRHERIGFTILIQGKAIGLMEEIRKLDPMMGTTAAEAIEVGEGQLIEMHYLLYGKRPLWNRTGGSIRGKRYATQAPALLDLLAAQRDSLFAARQTLRSIAGSFRSRLFEATIHASRMRAMMEAHDAAKIPQPDEQIVASRVERVLMLRDGHLVEELDASDADIRRWLELLGRPEHWRQEASAWRSAFEQGAGRPLEPQEKQVLALLDAVMDQAAPPQHIFATRDILDGGYLDQPITIP
jgi:hypothetical protein